MFPFLQPPLGRITLALPGVVNCCRLLRRARTEDVGIHSARVCDPIQEVLDVFQSPRLQIMV